MPSQVPKGRRIILDVIRQLRANPHSITKLQILQTLSKVVPMLHRDRPKRRAPNQRKTPTSKEDKAAIRAFEEAHPEMTLDAVAAVFDTSSGRVSEIINGVRSSAPEFLPKTQREMDNRG